jgi:YVTN family beta-propeller protein
LLNAVAEMWRRLSETRLVLGALAALVGCGGASTSALKKDAGAFGGDGGLGAAPRPPMFAADAGAPAPDGGVRPPEMEERRTFEAPRAGARHVYVANPRRDTVAVIDSTNLAIRSVEVGDTPTYLQTIPGKDVALVINVGSRDVSILRTEGGATRTSTVPVVPGVNSLAVAPDGGHVIAWFDSPAAGPATTGGPPGSFQDVSLIRLGEPDQAIPLTVGFRPTAVAFAADGSAGFVVTEDGISVLRFADIRGPAVAPLVLVGDAAADAARDVSITPDGRYALSRREGEARVELVDLATRAVTPLELPSPVTDLDLSPAGDFAVAVLREAGVVVRLAIPAGFADPAERQDLTVPGEAVGSATLTPDGKTALLYTTATPVERLVILDLGSGAARPVRLKKGVRAVAVAPDGRTALVVHTRTTGDPRQPGLDVETSIDRAHGYSVVDLASAFAKLQLTSAPVGELAITPDASRAFVLLRDDAASVRVAQRIELGSFLVDDFPLGSPPLSIAALADSKRMFVSQVHPEGRISFIHWETGAVESVTGFELNGRIVQ